MEVGRKISYLLPVQMTRRAEVHRKPPGGDRLRTMAGGQEPRQMGSRLLEMTGKTNCERRRGGSLKLHNTQGVHDRCKETAMSHGDRRPLQPRPNPETAVP